MNETTNRIVGEAQSRIRQLADQIDDLRGEMEDMRKCLASYERERNELAEVIAKLDSKTQTLARIRWVNTDNLDGEYAAPVVVHGAECSHLSRIRQEPHVQVGMTEISNVEQWNSKESFARDYNSDFHAEGGIEGCWPIAFYPCTGFVNETTVMTGYED